MVLNLLCTVLLVAVCPGARADLTVITEDNWRDLLSGEWMVEFFAPWCPACRGLQPTWEEFGGWSDDLEIGVGQVDVTLSPGLSGRFMVTALPTIFHVKEGVFRQYRGARDKDSLISFVEDKKWEGVEATSGWTEPDSIQMSMVSYFFKLSMVLRNVHTTLTEDYGFPSWVSYVAFAVATILLGGILGLILVCVIDCVYPPSRSKGGEGRVVQMQQQEVGDQGEGEDLEEDEDGDEEGDQTEEEELSQGETDSQGEESMSQGEQSQESQAEEEESAPQENRARRRRARKAD